MKDDDIKAIKDLKDAKEDLSKLDEILNDVDKFRMKSNKVYHEITGKIDYAPYIVAARLKNKLTYGRIPFENITNYMSRREIISALRQAVNAYIAAEVINNATGEKK